MRKYSIAFILVVTLMSCGKLKEQSKDDENDDEHHDYYQKNLRFDGFQGQIDSIISKVYEAEGLSKGELVSWDIKRFNADGYVVSHETRAYEDEELFSAGQTLYTRDSNSLESEQINNYLSRTGAGYTLQYTLVDRGLNQETWELLRNIPGKGVELLAEVREYTKQGLQIFTQVGNTDSTALRYEYKYLDNGLDEAILFYDNGKVLQEIQKVYNAEGFPISLTTLYKNKSSEVDYEKVETYEYGYDESKNPISIKIFDEGILMGIIENEIFYRK